MGFRDRKRRLAVISNPHSGRHTRRAGLARVIGSYLAAPRWHYSPETLSDLDDAVAEIGRQAPDVVAFIGGDGAVHQGLTRLLLESDGKGSLPQILVVPTGTMNGLAVALGLQRWTIEQLARRVREKLDSGLPFDTVNLAPVRVGDEYGFLYGSGYPSAILERYYAAPGRGPRTVALLSARLLAESLLASLTFGRLGRQHFELSSSIVEVYDGVGFRPSPHPAHSAILAGTIESVGLGCKALPAAREKPLEFMLRASAMTFGGFMVALGPLWAGLPLPRTFDATTCLARITHETPTVAMLDGDLLAPARDVQISIGPMLSFITG